MSPQTKAARPNGGGEHDQSAVGRLPEEPATKPPFDSAYMPAAWLGLQSVLFMEAWLKTTRSGMDAWRNIARKQQDLLLDTWQSLLSRNVGASETLIPTEPANAGLMTPLLAAADAYKKFGETVFEFEREAVERMHDNKTSE